MRAHFLGLPLPLLRLCCSRGAPTHLLPTPPPGLAWLHSTPLPLARTQGRFSQSAETLGRSVWTSTCLRATHTMEYMLNTQPKPTPQNTIQSIILICTIQLPLSCLKSD